MASKTINTIRVMGNFDRAEEQERQRAPDRPHVLADEPDDPTEWTLFDPRGDICTQWLTIDAGDAIPEEDWL